MRTAVHQERLVNLLRVAHGIHESRIDMSCWSNIDNECGTALCLACWFALDEWAQEHTPILDIFKRWPRPGNKIIVSPIDPATARQQLQEFFGITAAECWRIFFPNEEHLRPGSTYRMLEPGFTVTKAMLLKNLDHLIAGEPLERYDAMTNLTTSDAFITGAV